MAYLYWIGIRTLAMSQNAFPSLEYPRFREPFESLNVNERFGCLNLQIFDGCELSGEMKRVQGSTTERRESLTILRRSSRQTAKSSAKLFNCNIPGIKVILKQWI